MLFPKLVKIVEVSPRDGLQNEPKVLSTDIKIDFINRLSATGLSVIEATSFVSPKWIPQLADGAEVFKGITKKASVSYPVLVPNRVGMEKALAAGVREVAVFTAASEEFSRKNTNCSIEESLQRIQEVVLLAKQNNVAVRAYISCVLGCPFSGKVEVEKVAALAKTLFALGCYEISLGDTIGIGTPLQTKQLIHTVSAGVPIDRLAVHFHDTYGQALANIFSALEEGIAIIDSAVSGIGGCPYASGATGNVATEDVVYMLHGMGIETGIQLDRLIAVGHFISTILARETTSRVARALTLSR